MLENLLCDIYNSVCTVKFHYEGKQATVILQIFKAL